jgi:hypothetical protein
MSHLHEPDADRHYMNTHLPECTCDRKTDSSNWNPDCEIDSHREQYEMLWRDRKMDAEKEQILNSLGYEIWSKALLAYHEEKSGAN